MTEVDPYRRWTRGVADLRARAAKLRRRTAAGASVEEMPNLLAQACDMCTALIQELAATHLQVTQLREQAVADHATHEHMLRQLPIPWVLTDSVGQILDANEDAASFLHLSLRHLPGRWLMHFTDDREQFSTLLARARDEHDRVSAIISLRPREHASRDRTVIVVPGGPEGASRWLWLLLPVDEDPARFAGPIGEPDRAARHASFATEEGASAK